MAYQFVTVDGQRVERNVAEDLARMNAAFQKAFPGIRLVVTSGTRTDAEQERIFRDRYVLAGDVRGRRVYDTRWWNGHLWYRVSPAGTVAVPGTSNHQESGPNGPRSIDIRDTGADAGVSVRGTRRDRWMQDHAHEYQFENEGYNFGEPWHKTNRGQIGVYPAPAAIITSEEDDMAIHVKRQKTGDTYTIVPGRYIKHHPDQKNGDIAGYLTTGSTSRPDFRDLNDGDLAIALWDLGFPELKGDTNKLPKNGGYYWSPGPSGKANYS